MKTYVNSYAASLRLQKFKKQNNGLDFSSNLFNEITKSAPKLEKFNPSMVLNQHNSFLPRCETSQKQFNFQFNNSLILTNAQEDLIESSQTIIQIQTPQLPLQYKNRKLREPLLKQNKEKYLFKNEFQQQILKIKLSPTTVIRDAQFFKNFNDTLLVVSNQDSYKFSIDDVLQKMKKIFKSEKKQQKGIILASDLENFNINLDPYQNTSVMKSEQVVVYQRMLEILQQQKKLTDLLFGLDTQIFKYILQLKWQKDIQKQMVVYIQEEWPIKIIMHIVDTGIQHSKLHPKRVKFSVNLK